MSPALLLAQCRLQCHSVPANTRVARKARILPEIAFVIERPFAAGEVVAGGLERGRADRERTADCERSTATSQARRETRTPNPFNCGRAGQGLRRRESDGPVAADADPGY